ncbi:MAG: hypothetical protein IT317_01050 [Anaerolineales bacterium]|nr:hypothetical protein [Anaerolineales bacterium]
MSPTLRKILLLALAGFGAACCCGLLVVLAAGGVAGYQLGFLVPAEPTLSPEQTTAKMAEIEAFVQATRGLTPTTPVALEFLTPDEVRQKTIADFEEDTTPQEMADGALSLAAFGLMDADVDLYSLLVDLYSDGIAGFYDPDSQQMVVVSGGSFNAYERTVYAHEYTHALQDQTFGIRASGFSDEMYLADPERFNAVQALLEGDASVLEGQYLNTYGPLERGYYNKIVNDVSSIPAVYYQLPRFLLQDFVFPYREGKAFVQHYYDQGGWARVDQLWNDPPVSSEQIMHLERFEAGDDPLLVARPPLTDTLGSGWRQIDTGVNGEWFTYLILAYGEYSDYHLEEDVARAAAEGWGGDGYSVFYNAAGDETVLAAEWQWDTPADAAEFAAAFREYGDKRFGVVGRAAGGGSCWLTTTSNCLYTTATGTLWLAAEQQATLDALLALFPAYGPP